MRTAPILLAFTLLSALSAQNISSTVKGTVHDSSGGVIPGAECTLTNQATNLKAVVNTASDGSFVFLDVLAGTYELSVKAPGFKVLNLRDIEVTSSEFHALNDIVLAVGTASESVTVAETAPPVQTVSGERSDLVGSTALSEIAVKGRDFLSYMQTLPGVIDTSYQSRDASGRNEMSGIHMNGARDTQALMLIDGTPVMDSGNNNIPEESTMDTIEEVKILTNAYQAEYGRNAGGTVSVITKSGSQNFHGTAYEYYRNEELNANSFFNNTTGTPRGPYRYRITGYTIGGPVWIPKVPSIRHKLFFFFGHEMLGSKVLFNPQYITMPTQLERNGDFSQSFNNAGQLITIKDPNNNLAAFPSNKIPQSEFNALGLSILKFYPLPNFTDPRPGYKYTDNYQATYSGGWPRTQEVGRMDYNLSSKTQLYFRVMNDTSLENSGWGNWVNGSVNYDLTPVAWNRPAHMYGGHLTETFSSTMVDEFMVQKTYNSVVINPIDASVLSRSLMGNPGEVFPHNLGNANWIPNVSFGGTPSSTVNSSLSNSLPEALPCDAYIVTNNLSKVWGRHQIKVGIYAERNRKIQPGSTAFRGTFSFAVDSNNPYNSGDGFANALLGYFDTYTEAQFNPVGNYLFWNVEWFAQDNWRVTSKLTLDFGLRFTHMPPTIDRNHNVAAMDPSLYSYANAPLLYRPALNGSARVAQNPLTGAFAPASYIGLFVPGAGNPADGSFVAGVNGNPPGLITTSYLEYGPRFGFAYDVFGNGKTAVRGGFGMFTDRVQGNEIYNTSGNPPVNYSPVEYYGNLNTYTQNAGVIGPSALTEWYGYQKMPEIMNFNLGVQQQVGSWVADVSYVGMLSRHLLETLNINPIPLYGHFNPAYRDPTTASSPLPDNFLRPYTGYANITQEIFGGSTNFNSFQASIRRRLAKGLQVSGAYTFSKALGTSGADGDGISPYLPARERNYGPLAFDRRQSVVISYVYQLPQAGTKLNVRPAKWVLDNWELSGVTTFQTGAPVTPGFNTQPSTDISGSTESSRINIVGNPTLSSGQRTFYREFNTAAFALPAVGTLGNGGVDYLYGPGVNNWDLSVTKRFKVFSESRSLSFRGEFYNAFNHTQFSGWNTTATFSPTGQLLSNTPFGQANAARLPRYVELSARFTF